MNWWSMVDTGDESVLRMPRPSSISPDLSQCHVIAAVIKLTTIVSLQYITWNMAELWFLISSKIAIRMHCLETLMVQRANGDIELQEHLRDQQPKIFFLKHCSLCKSTNSGCSLLLQGLVFTAILLASRRSVITSISNHQKRMCFFCVHNRKGFLLGSNFACDGYILGLL